MAQSPTYFWNCLPFTKECPSLQNINPKLCYLCYCVIGAYCAFLVMVLTNLKFWWSMDKLLQQVEFYVTTVKKKLQKVDLDQEHSVSIKERTRKQLERSHECTRVVSALRGAAAGNDTHSLKVLADVIDCTKDPVNIWNDEAESFLDIQ